MTETCTRCGESFALSEVLIKGERDEVICPDCTEPEDRIIPDGGEESGPETDTKEPAHGTRKLKHGPGGPDIMFPITLCPEDPRDRQEAEVALRAGNSDHVIGKGFDLQLVDGALAIVGRIQCQCGWSTEGVFYPGPGSVPDADAQPDTDTEVDADGGQPADATLEHCPRAGADDHRFDPLGAKVAGHGSSTRTAVIEQCRYCQNLRINYDVELLGEVG